MAQTLTTAQDFIDRIREELRDPNGENFHDPELIGYINEGVDIIWRELATKAPWYFDSTTHMKEQALTITSGVREYALASDFLLERLLMVDGDEVSKLHLEDETDADAEGYLLQQGYIRLFPSPLVSGTGTFYYIAAPTIITSPTGTVQLGTDFGQEIKKYVVGCCKARHEEDMMGAGILEARLRRAAIGFALRRNAPAAWGFGMRYLRYF